MKKQIASTKKFVSTHRVAIAVVATSIAWISLDRKRVDEWNSFLAEHNLTEAFYNTEE